MRLIALLFTAILVASPSPAQPAPPSSTQQAASADQDNGKKDTKNDKDAKDRKLNLPVSLDKIRDALQQPPRLSLRTLDETPTFRMQILERQKIEELLATLNFKTPARRRPAGSTCTSSSGRC